MRELVERMRALEHAVHEAGALRREEFAGGVAYYNEELPLVWDVNFVRADHLIVYSDGGLAQIEDVGVLRRFRGRGLARRMVEHALEVVAADHDAVFLTAETNDWPADFYRRLGFEHVEDRADFLLIRPH